VIKVTCDRCKLKVDTEGYPARLVGSDMVDLCGECVTKLHELSRSFAVHREKCLKSFMEGK